MVKIGNYNVEKLLIDLYIDNFSTSKDDVFEFEKRRKTLHDAIFISLGLDRHSDEGQKFSKLFDDYCEPRILKIDKFTVLTKKLSNAKSKSEIDEATLELKLELEKKKFRELSGIREKPVQKDGKVNQCRVCNKKLGEGIPRVNDHMACVRGFEEMDYPICMDCSDNNPDEYNIEFRKQYWKH